MEIHRIFANVYSVKYEGQDHHEFKRLFNNWNNPEYLESFFEEHKDDLKADFYNGMSVEQAIFDTLDDADWLQKKMITLAKANDGDGFQGMFLPLHQMEKSGIIFSDRKAYGGMEKSWLRLYAIRTQDGVLMITGGCIKLTRAIQDRAHSERELLKMQQCKDFLKQEGIYDQDGFLDLEF